MFGPAIRKEATTSQLLKEVAAIMLVAGALGLVLGFTMAIILLYP